MVAQPEWIVVVDNEKVPRSIQFGNLFSLKDRIKDLTLLWNYNSYRVDLRKREFIVNGGRRVSFPLWQGYNDVRIQYARRVSKKVALANINDVLSAEVSFLLGMVHYENDEIKHEVYLQVSEDGTKWRWLNHR